MVEKVDADASPEKRLFISLLTRDIPLVSAFLDLIDNSINAAVEPVSSRLLTASDYLNVLQDETVQPAVVIRVNFDAEGVSIIDTATGISSATAKAHVFKFGRAAGESHTADRLSVYGIGLKRALFKLGHKITIRSDHESGGFDLKLDVEQWARDRSQPWTFPITPRAPAKDGQTGTRISVTGLHDETKRRILDGLFLAQLKDMVAKTYSFYLTKFVSIYVNDDLIAGVITEIGTNHASETFSVGDVSCSVTAGIGLPQGGNFRDRAAGWFVFCNGRTVISADKSPLTGWGSPGRPIFQPKHRPFVGTVFFVSKDAEQLPWTTTKASINEDNAIWQEAKRHMVSAARVVIAFLDSRYTDEGTDVPSADLRLAAGPAVSVMSAAVAPRQIFSPPTSPAPKNTRIQFDAKVVDVARIAQYLGRRSMSAADVGRHTFHHFLANEVGDK